MLVKGAHGLKLYLNDAMVSKNNVIDVFDNRIIAIDTIAKYLSCLIGDKAMLMI